MARVNRAIDYVLAHLEEPLRLEEVAREACFSPFHFHRVFSAVTGETLNQFVKRVRLERALRMLSHEPARTLTDVAFACGFASSSDFSRSFRQRYGLPPSALDVEVFRRERRTEWLAAIDDPTLRHRLRRLPPGENPDGFRVRLRDLPARRVAYIRVLDPYRPDVVSDAAGRLVEWARRRGLAGGRWLGYMWDDPEIVVHTDCRYDVGVEVPRVESRVETQIEGRAEPQGEPVSEVGRFDFPPMRVAELRIVGPIDLEMRALDWLFSTWLPGSGYAPTDDPCFEAWHGLPFAHGHEHFELDIHLPVERI